MLKQQLQAALADLDSRIDSRQKQHDNEKGQLQRHRAKLARILALPDEDFAALDAAGVFEVVEPLSQG